MAAAFGRGGGGGGPDSYMCVYSTYLVRLTKHKPDRHFRCPTQHIIGGILRQHISGDILRQHIRGGILRQHISGGILRQHSSGNYT